MKYSRSKFIFFFSLVVSLGVFGFLAVALAQPDLGISSAAGTGLSNVDIRITIAKIIRAALGLLGIVAVVLALYAGFEWMTAGGNEEKIASAKKILSNSVIGLIIILSSYAIVSFVMSKLVEGTGGAPHCYNSITDEDETAPDCGGADCRACTVNDCPSGNCLTNNFYVDQMFAGGQMCIRNVKPEIVFSEAPDFTTLNTAGNAFVKVASTTQDVEGAWGVGAKPNIAVFTPIGDCGGGANDCLSPSTTYILRLSSNILSVGGRELACAVNNACAAVTFTTGEGVDRERPQLSLDLPSANVESGQTMSLKINFSDDYGVQNISGYVDGSYFGGQSLTGCQRSGSTTIDWNTTGVTLGSRLLTMVGTDWAALEGTATATAIVRPTHCYNYSKDVDETGVDCGGAQCGRCDSDNCAVNSDCASGYCDEATHKCLAKLRIDRVNPWNGAPGNYVTISGRSFGTSAGKVYFKQGIAGNGDIIWVPASLPCGNSTPWSDNQIIVEVPSAAASGGPIKVVAADSDTRVPALKVDITNDSWGTRENFTVNNDIRPGLCPVIPESGYPSRVVSLTGKNFGTEGAVKFGDNPAFVENGNWANTFINATVPPLSPSTVGVSVTSNGAESNSVRFTVLATGVDSGSARVTAVSPTRGAPGTYITISGQKFGNTTGRVLFKENGSATAVPGTFDFPAGCENTWRDDQIVVKFPVSGVNPGSAYSVQVEPYQGDLTPIENNYFNLESGKPAPGICKIDPESGPLPLPNNRKLFIYGSNFTTTNPNSSYLARWVFDNGHFSSQTGPTIYTIKDIGVNNYDFNNPNGDGKQDNETLRFDNNSMRVSTRRVLGVSGNELSISLLVNLADISNQENIFALPNLSASAGGFRLYRDNTNQTQTLTFAAWYKNSSGVLQANTSTIRLVQNNWYRLTFVLFDDGTVKYYLGGILQSTKKSSNFASWNFPNTSFFIGAIGGLAASPGFVGKVDDVRIYQKAISADDITSLANDSSPGHQSTSVGSLIPAVYFWQNGASPLTLDGRLRVFAPAGTFSDKQLSITVPNSLPLGPGPVVVYRGVDNQISNQVNFTVQDCTQNNNTCTISGYQCCTNGAEKGICKPGGEVCVGQERSSGYLWRFSTKDIPTPLKVVEQCSTDATYLPSPSPSTLWDTAGGEAVHENVCKTALVEVVFSRSDVNSINKNLARVFKCSSDPRAGGSCEEEVPVSNFAASDQNGQYRVGLASGQDASSSQGYLELAPNAGQWNDNTWYQVKLADTISAGNGEEQQTLAPARPCGSGTAYCFYFRTDSRECSLSRILITPSQYWTNQLEAPLRYHAASGGVYDLFYAGHGLSSQKCVMMDMRGYNWQWSSQRPKFADIDSGAGTQNQVQVTTKRNTKDIGLKNPADAVNIHAQASKDQFNYPADSPLVIDLSNPQVVDNWPNCLEACTDAAMGVKFNIPMSSVNLDKTAIKLYRCETEDCLVKTDISNDFLAQMRARLQIGDKSTIELVPSSTVGLEKNTIYWISVSAHYDSKPEEPVDALDTVWSAAADTDDASYSKPYNFEYTWKFKTKSEACKIDRVEVLPKVFNARSISAKAIYSATPFSAPDSCSSVGQRLRADTVGWNWSADDFLVATTSQFQSRGKNNYCSGSCVRKGSDIPYGANGTGVNGSFRACGNGRIDAGEDCDIAIAGENAQSCTLNCLRPGSAPAVAGAGCGNGDVEPNFGEECDPASLTPEESINCSNKCLHIGSQVTPVATAVNASICGNGAIGVGEECDFGIVASSTRLDSALGCTAKCLHEGTRLAKSWCHNHEADHGGYNSAEFDKLCALAYSQCGDNITDPDEDTGCDTGTNPAGNNCDQYCLKLSGECAPGTEGCDDNGRKAGSSLLYSTPSLCGDSQTGLGEESYCEGGTDFAITRTIALYDPWALARAIGYGSVVLNSNPPVQRTNISAVTNQNTAGNVNKTGSGKFELTCGYQTDAECSGVNAGYGLASNSCCYARPHLLSVYPGTLVNTATEVCPNTAITATFDSPIDETSLAGNLLIASENSGDSCPTGTVQVDDGFVTFNSNNLSWPQKIWQKLAGFWRNLTGTPTAQALWCSGQDLGKARVINTLNNSGQFTSSTVSVALNSPLGFNKTYRIYFTPGVRDYRGVSIGATSTWNFITAGEMCLIEKVQVSPANHFFSVSGATTSLQAFAKTDKGAYIQPIAGSYYWNYIWGPKDNGFVQITSTSADINLVSALNNNGEIDIAAGANVTENNYSSDSGVVATGRSHLIVFLCENPWPPKDLNQGGINYEIFPYRDEAGNRDGYSFVSNTFDGSAIPPSSALASGAGGELMSDGYYNFHTYYCADKGQSGTFDDLPYLRPAVQVAPSIVSVTTSVKRFIFTDRYGRSSDAIGIQVFTNPEFKTIRDWLSDRGVSLSGFNNLSSQDGYEAVIDAAGNNIYVQALDLYYSTADKLQGYLNSQIFLFSINADAGADMKNVFKQILTYLRFNTNLTNYGYCGQAVDTPALGPERTVCRTDFDCVGNLSGQVCAVQTDKLKRDYKRLRDLKSIGQLLNNYYQNSSDVATARVFPKLSEGTYLSGQTVSTWPSWGVLGNALGQQLPHDPAEQLAGKMAPAGSCSVTTNQFCVADANCPSGETCVLHNPLTGWSTENRRFSFACDPHSFAYRYVFSTSTGFQLRNRWENIGVDVKNRGQISSLFLDDRSGEDRFTAKNDFGFYDPTENYYSPSGGGVGICLQNNEVSTFAPGVCGDGQLNLDQGEQCDPPGAKIYSPTCSAGKRAVQTCNSTCQLVDGQEDCYNGALCGNGRIDLGESCDDGVLNGRYGHCNNDCLGFGGAGFCGDGSFSSINEFCDTNSAGKCVHDSSTGLAAGSRACSAYDINKNNSCQTDCSNFGGFCGDGLADKTQDEYCESNSSCSGGTTNCNKCSDGEAYFDLNFNKILASGSSRKVLVDNQNNGRAYCSLTPSPGSCPEVIDHGDKNGGQAGYFDGTDYLAVSSSYFGSILGDNFTISVWIKPDETQTAATEYGRIVEKAGAYPVKGFALTYVSTASGAPANHIILHLFNSDNTALPLQSVETESNTIKRGEWNHVVVSHSSSTQLASIYINGQLMSTVSYGFGVSSDTDLTIGARKYYLSDVLPPNEFFKGSMDDLRVYPRVLGGTEVEDIFNNNLVCNRASAPVTVAGSCGDGHVDENEACDNGASNGVSCSSAYNVSCSYCSADCRNVIVKEPAGYCGDGVINGPEVCDTDQVRKYAGTNLPVIWAKDRGLETGTDLDPVHLGYYSNTCSEVYNRFLNNDTSFWVDQILDPSFPSSTSYTPYIPRKTGDKQCVNNCMTLVSNCTACGNVPDGVEISGKVVNVLEPSSTNPLYKFSGTLPAGTSSTYYSGTMDLFYTRPDYYIIWSPPIPTGAMQRVAAASIDADHTSYTFREGASSSYYETALINPDPRCSINLSSATSPAYYLTINGRRGRTGLSGASDNNTIQRGIFQVSGPSQAKPGQYDLLLSPRLSVTSTPGHIRLVVSWNDTGMSSDGLVPGFLTSSGSSLSEPGSFVITTGRTYFNDISRKKFGIWYHGFKSLPTRTSEFAFTVDVNDPNFINKNYIFYVRTASGQRISDYQNAKVEVYLPDNFGDPRPGEPVPLGFENGAGFSFPYRTYKLNTATRSDNSEASFWHVLNIRPRGGSDQVANSYNFVGVNRLRTEGNLSLSY